MVAVVLLGPGVFKGCNSVRMTDTHSYHKRPGDSKSKEKTEIKRSHGDLLKPGLYSVAINLE